MPLFTVVKDPGCPSFDLPEFGLFGLKPGDEVELPEAPNTDLLVPKKAPKAEPVKPEEGVK